MGNTLIFLIINGLIFVECQRRFHRQNNDFQKSSDCLTPNGERGECLNIRQCQKLVDLLVTSRNKPEVVTYLRRSLCEYGSNDPIVCCPGVQSDQPNQYQTTKRNTDVNENLGDRRDGYRNILSPPNCGHSDVGHSRIVGGSPAELGAWPWMAALGMRSKSNPSASLQWLCGGALVSEKHVVTAAHCTQHPRLRIVSVKLGDLNLNDNVRDGASPIHVPVRSIAVHPRYAADTKFHDIAVLYLSENVRSTKLIQPICLPKSPEIRSNNFVKQYPFVAGWGSVSFKGPSSSKLQEVQLPVVGNDDCYRAYKPLGGEITSNQLCAGYMKGGKDACQGDSGGPLMLPKNGSYYLIGIVSYGYRCAEAGYPGIYTRVTSYLDWLNEKLV